MSVMELKAPARDCGLRSYSWMRKAELVALFQNNGTQRGPRPYRPILHQCEAEALGPQLPTPGLLAQIGLHHLHRGVQHM